MSRIAIVAALALLASSASAQSLADVARQEEARRAAVKAAAKAKVLTNASLAADPRAAGMASEPSAAMAAPAPQPAAAAVAAPASANPGNASAGAVAAAAPPATKPKEDEAAWRKRAADLRARVDNAQQAVDRFTTGTPAEDPREQARVEASKKKAQDTLTRAEDALRLLIMQADVAGVPADWVK